MKRTIILYGSPKQYSAAHKRVHCSGQPEYFVRMEVSPYGIAEALEHAKPKPGETVLNTVEAES